MFEYGRHLPWASLVAQIVKNPPAKWETWVRSLGQEDPLEEGMAIHSSNLAWRTFTVIINFNYFFALDISNFF